MAKEPRGGQRTTPMPGEKRPKNPPAPPIKGDPQAPFEVIDAAVLMKAINRAVNAVPGIKRIPNKDYLDLYIEALDELRDELALQKDEPW